MGRNIFSSTGYMMMKTKTYCQVVSMIFINFTSKVPELAWVNIDIAMYLYVFIYIWINIGIDVNEQMSKYLFLYIPLTMIWINTWIDYTFSIQISFETWKYISTPRFPIQRIAKTWKQKHLSQNRWVYRNNRNTRMIGLSNQSASSNRGD